MHELSITRNIVAIAGEAASGRAVRRVRLRIGKLSGIMPDAVVFCFPIVAQGTALAGAALDIEEVDGRCRCGDCGTEFLLERFGTPCACGSSNVRLIGGDELKIASIDVEEAA